MKPSVQRVHDALAAAGVEPRIKEFPESTRTAAEAAAAIGCDTSEIVKSLVFAADGVPVLVLMDGSSRVDVERVRAELGAGKVTRPDAAVVREATGYAIGGVPPVGHPAPLHTVIDPQLGRFETVWAAAGTPHAVFPIAYDDLVRVTGGEVRPVS